jgi:hypothetical protein
MRKLCSTSLFFSFTGQQQDTALYTYCTRTAVH